MIDSVPSRAPTSPPDTGASNAVSPHLRRGVENRPRHRRRDRAHVDQELTGPRAGDHAVIAEVDLLDVGRVGQHRDHDVAALGDLFGRVGDIRVRARR